MKIKSQNWSLNGFHQRITNYGEMSSLINDFCQAFSEVLPKDTRCLQECIVKDKGQDKEEIR